MNKKLKDKFFYVMIFIFVFIVPNIFFYYKSIENRDLFYQYARENRQICVQRAEEDSLNKRWCDEIYSASKDNYSSTENSHDILLLMSLFQPILFVLIIGFGNLRKQVEELKEKINA